MNLDDNETQLWTHGYCAGRIDERKATSPAEGLVGRVLAALRRAVRRPS